MAFDAKRSIYLTGDIDSQTSMGVISEMSRFHAEDSKSIINLFIASGGGNVGDAYAIYDYVMGALKPELQTIALGEANSMAIALFLMGNMRYIGKLAIMRFHRFSLSSNHGITSEKAHRMVQDLNRSEEGYINILISRTEGKINKKKANALLDGNADVTAAEAIELGLAHKIL